jgi:hypothetical protein
VVEVVDDGRTEIGIGMKGSTIEGGAIWVVDVEGGFDGLAESGAAPSGEIVGAIVEADVRTEDFAPALGLTPVDLGVDPPTWLSAVVVEVAGGIDTGA